MKQKIYLSTKFYAGRPFRELEPEVELKALQYLLSRLVEQEKYEVATIAKERINEIQQQLITEATWCILKEIKLSLN